jgi:hypothetical protein
MQSKTTYHDIDSDTAVLVKEYKHSDIQKVAEYAKECHNSGIHGTKEDKVVASVHPAVIMAWIEKRGITMHQFMSEPKIAIQFLEDPDNSSFRIWKGKI